MIAVVVGRTRNEEIIAGLREKSPTIPTGLPITSGAAKLVLLAVGQSIQPTPIGPDQGAFHGAGEYELSSGGQALAIDPKRLGAEPRIVLIASPHQLETGSLVRLPSDAGAIAAALPDCAIDLLRFDVAGDDSTPDGQRRRP